MRVWLALLATLTLLTVGPGATAGTSDPPRNGLIAAGGVDGIYLIDAEGAKAWKVPGTLDMDAPAWSPDGSRLAVEGWDESGRNVYTIRPDGSDRQLVLRNAGSPSWSPDGKRLVVVRDGESSGVLVTVRADGSEAQQVTFDYGTDSDGANDPVWSPDGKWIAFVGGKGAVNLVSPSGEDDGVRTIADSGSVASYDGGSNLAWSPDSSRLAFDVFDRKQDFKEEIVVVDVATGLRTKLPPRPSDMSALAWSPEGNQLAFLSSRAPEVQGHCGGEIAWDLWEMNADGSNPHRLSKGSYAQPSWGTFLPEPKPSSQPTEPKPSFQPEPKPSAGSGPIAGTRSAPTAASNATKTPRTAPRIVAPAVTRRALGKGLIAARGRDAIYLIHPQRGEVRRIPGTAKMAQPAWSPNGSLLAVEHGDADGGSVYTIRPDGSHPQLVLRNASSPSWSPDGNRLFVVRDVCLAQDGCAAGDDGSAVLITVRPDGSDARAVDVENEDVYDAGEPAVPPDGNWIAFFADKGPNPASFDSSAAAWSPDAKQLAFVSGSTTAAEDASGDDTNSGLWVVAADAGKPPHLLATGIYGRPSWRVEPDPRPSG